VNFETGSHSAAWQAVTRLAIVLAIACCIGFVVGRPWLTLTVFLSIYLFVQIWNLLRLERWLRRRRWEPPPDVNGPWGEVIPSSIGCIAARITIAPRSPICCVSSGG